MVTLTKLIPVLLFATLSINSPLNNLEYSESPCSSLSINCNGSIPDTCCSYWTTKFSLETKSVWFGFGTRFFTKWECTTGGEDICYFNCKSEPEEEG